MDQQTLTDPYSILPRRSRYTSFSNAYQSFPNGEHMHIINFFNYRLLKLYKIVFLHRMEWSSRSIIKKNCKIHKDIKLCSNIVLKQWSEEQSQTKLENTKISFKKTFYQNEWCTEKAMFKAIFTSANTNVKSEMISIYNFITWLGKNEQTKWKIFKEET